MTKRKERTTVILNKKRLTDARRASAADGVPMNVAGSTSRFIRYLVDEYCIRHGVDE